VILAALLCVCVSFAAAEEAPRILFIGNSLTGANDLPQIVCRLAEASGRRMTCEAVVVNGYSLADHLQDGNVQKKIESRQWTIVVLQQGPSALDENRVDLRRAVQRFLPLSMFPALRTGPPSFTRTAPASRCSMPLFSRVSFSAYDRFHSKSPPAVSFVFRQNN